MRFSKFVYLFVLIFYNCSAVWAEVPDLSARALSSPPRRVTRTCCAFGSDLKLSIIPILKYSDITSVDQLGPHHYLGDSGEGNGIIYTLRGGFVDMGHLRDQADWTAYLYCRIVLAKNKGYISIHLGREGGSRILNLNVPADLNSDDAVQLAGRVAYDLSVWHEIATWYGSSSIPLMPERYSSFSVEDPYSNLLGVTIGMAAIKSSLPYEQAMNELITSNLVMLGAVSSENETYMAMEAVRNIWWTRVKHLPSRNILIERQLGVYSCLEPWRVPGWANAKITSYDLVIPDKTSDGQSLNNFYELDFKLNYKFPLREIFASRTGRRVTQADFGQLINHIAKDLVVGKLHRTISAAREL
jgi:hypothetical protein